MLNSSKHGSVTQLGEYLICIQEVESSSLFRSTNGCVTQLARVVGSYPACRGFESPRSYQKHIIPIAK